jgi:hypothetical protein
MIVQAILKLNVDNGGVSVFIFGHAEGDEGDAWFHGG